MSTNEIDDSFSVIYSGEMDYDAYVQTLDKLDAQIETLMNSNRDLKKDRTYLNKKLQRARAENARLKDKVVKTRKMLQRNIEALKSALVRMSANDI
jgi:septal ring factor EnvC (AmiA/AmiB activator)